VTYHYEIKDGCNNPATDVDITYSGGDTQAPVITNCKSNSTRLFDAGQIYYTVVGNEFDVTATDNCSLSSLVYNLTGATSGTGTSLATKRLNGGNTTITWTATDTCGKSSTCAFTVTVNKRPTVVKYIGDQTEQYSDVTDLKALLYDAGNDLNYSNCTTKDESKWTLLCSKNIKFTVGTQSTVDFLTAVTGQATGTLKLNQSSGNCNVTAAFAGDSTYCSSSNNLNCISTDDQFVMTKENAVADYTGQDFASTGTATSTSSLVRLSATIRDITAVPVSGDPEGGDIRNAKARFKLRGVNPSNGSEVVPEFNTEWINVTLLGTDIKVGSILKDLTLTIPGSLESVIFEIKVEVGDNGYYCNSDATAIIGTLTLSKSLNDFVTFGGNLKMTPNTSYGYYPSNNDSKINFGGSVKYNKNGTNMQGGINIIWRTGTNVYQIKGIVGGSNGSMSVNIANANEKKAVVIAKANVYDTQTGAAVPNSSGAIVTLNLVDKGEPGVNDQISIELRNSAGTLLLSSKWTGIKTDLLTLTGGNIQVKSTATVTAVKEETTEETPDETVTNLKLPFNIKAYPNPSSQYFNLNIEGYDGEEAEIMVYNSAGILIDQFKQKANQENQLGQNWARGMYIVQIKKGVEVKTIKLMKNN